MPASRSFDEREAASTAAQHQHEVRLAADAAEEVVRRGREAGLPPADVPPFAHLAVRSCFSLRDGAIRPRELAAAVAAAGMTHVALTDRDGLYGAVRFAQACAAEGVTPVFGADLALAADLERDGWGISRPGRHRVPTDATQDPRSRRPGRGPGWLEDDAARVTLLARTTAGYGDLCRTVTAAHLHSERGAPHLAWDDVPTATVTEGTVVVLGADSPVGRLLADGRLDAAEVELGRWLEVFGRSGVRLGVRSWLEGDDERARIRHTLALADHLRVQAVATNDVRYLRPEDVALADVLACVRQQVPLGARHLGRVTAEAYLTTPVEQLGRFRERPDLLAAAAELAVSCEVDLGLGGLHVPRLTGMADEVAAGELHRRVWQGVAARYPRVTPTVRERLERELAMVDRLGLHDYFLTVADIVAAVRGSGIIAACRGSAAGSLVCYALRISDVDPVAHGLAFERFMNPYRDELPDIDLDVESARREDVYDLVMARYGGEVTDAETKVAAVAMVETFQARMAVREVGKVLGLPGDEIDLVAKSFVHARARDVRTALERLPELRGSRIGAGQLERLFTIVERIDGFPRHLALHPCGILLADRRLTDRTPLERSAPRDDRPDGYRMTQFDKDDVAALGILKLDVLAVRMLSAVRHTLDLVPQVRDGAAAELTWDTIPGDDVETYDLIRSTRSVGMFQIESPGQRELLGRIQPRTFGDLIVEISLFRPGPVKADMVTPFVRRRHGEEPPFYAHPALEPVLRETHGVVVFHEQVMGALAALTGCDLSYADLLRRQLSDDRKLPAIRAWVIARAVDRGLRREDAEQVWAQVASFASFGFCKAHAAAFAVPTYRSAYLKAHHLPEFMAGLLTHDPGMYPRRLILDEARSFGVAVLPPDVNRSDEPYTVEVIDRGQAEHHLGLRGPRLPPGWSRDGDRFVPPAGLDKGEAGGGYRYAVRIGLQDVRGITADEIASLIAGRPFTSLTDVRDRARLASSTATALARAGAFDHLAGVGRTANGAAITRRHVELWTGEHWARQRRAPRPGQARQVPLALDADHHPQLPAESDADRVRGELATTGMDVTRHVVSFYEPLLEVLGVARACDLEDLPSQQTVRVAGVKVALQSPAQRSGQRVLFLSLDDRTGTTQATFFERSLEDNAWTLLHAWLFVIEGRISRRSTARWQVHDREVSGVTVTGTRAWDLSRLWRAWHEGWLADALDERGTPAPHERMVPRPEGLRAAEWGRGSR